MPGVCILKKFWRHLLLEISLITRHGFCFVVEGCKDDGVGAAEAFSAVLHLATTAVNEAGNMAVTRL